MNKLEAKVKNYISSNKLINGKKVILAFSYGVDSRSLFNVLINLKIDFVVCHVNHKKRKESDIEEKETKLLCQKYNIPCYVKTLVPQNENFENYARKERYKFFNEISKIENTNILVTAHHKDDNLETILLKLMTGSNMYGYAGIHNISYHDNLTIIRPFLCLSKDEIYEYAKENNLKYFEDYTNKENEAKRNRIRNLIIPLLKKESNDILDKAYDFSDILCTSFAYIRKQAIEYYNKWNDKIDNLEYKNLDIALRKDILCYTLEQKHINRSKSLIDNIDNIIISSAPQKELKLENNMFFFKRYDISYIDLKTKTEPLSFKLNLNDKINFFNHTIYFTNKEPNSNVFYIKLCYNEIKLPLSIRTRNNGDKISLSSGNKKIKDLFIDKKIVKENRDKTPLILEGDEIIWIPGVAKSLKIKNYLEHHDIYLVDEVKQNDER